MNQHHPDKQAARGLPDAMLEVAKERTREIRSAYELIKERRNIK
jgi:DnaJ like chaperone protein